MDAGDDDDDDTGDNDTDSRNRRLTRDSRNRRLTRDSRNRRLTRDSRIPYSVKIPPKSSPEKNEKPQVQLVRPSFFLF